PVMFRAKRTTPPTCVSQRSRSTAWFPSASVPSKPTSRSWPRSVSSAARRTGSSGGYVRQPAAATTRRLAATSRRNEPLHPPPVAERVVGVGLDDPLVGDDGARVDVDADEPAADGGDDG